MAFSWTDWFHQHRESIPRARTPDPEGDEHALLEAVVAALTADSPQPLIAALMARKHSWTPALRTLLSLRTGIQTALETVRPRPRGSAARRERVGTLCETAILAFLEKMEAQASVERARLKRFQLVDSTRRVLTSEIDPLTNVYNHRHFRVRLDEEVERAMRYGETLSLLLCDGDHFVRLERQHGVAATEEALRNLAGAMTALTRRVDLVARLEWDQFGILLPEIGIHGAYATAEKIRHGVERLRFPLGHPLHDWQLSVSVGISNYHHDAASVETLLDHARHCLQHAKLAGRNRTVAAE